MRREAFMPEAAPVRLVQLVRSFYLGGTEGQVVELLRGLPPRYLTQVAVLDFKGPLAEEVAQLGYVPGEFPLAGSVVHPQTAVQVARLAQWLKARRVELVHVHDFYGAVLAVPAAKLAGAKVIIGRLDLAHWHSQLQRAVLRAWTRAADHVIANAGAIREQLIHEEGVAPERISVIRNGLDVRRFDEKARGGLLAPLPDTHGAPVIVHVANMNHEVKRQEDLLTALSLLQARGQPAHVFFVGDGPRRAALEGRAAELGVAGRAHFLGHRRDVPAVYGRAAVGVLCSTHEGMSNAVMEGMAAGLPMVVTRVGGSPDLIEDGARGRVVPAKAPEALAGALAELLSRPDEARAMGARARRFVEQELSLERLVARHDAVYRAVLGR